LYEAALIKLTVNRMNIKIKPLTRSQINAACKVQGVAGLVERAQSEG